jgi:hypothetical protein
MAALDNIVERPYMLDDITVDVQRLSAALPPDNWDPETHKPLGLARQPSGVFQLVRWPSLNDEDDSKLTLLCAKPALQGENEATVVDSDAKRTSWCATLCDWLRRRFSKSRDEG